MASQWSEKWQVRLRIAFLIVFAQAEKSSQKQFIGSKQDKVLFWSMLIIGCLDAVYNTGVDEACPRWER